MDTDVARGGCRHERSGRRLGVAQRRGRRRRAGGRPEGGRQDRRLRSGRHHGGLWARRLLDPRTRHGRSVPGPRLGRRDGDTGHHPSPGVVRRGSASLPEKSLLGVPYDADAVASEGILSPAGLAELRSGLDRRPPPLAGDASMGSVLRPHTGDEAFDRLIDPLLGGIHAGPRRRDEPGGMRPGPAYRCPVGRAFGVSAEVGGGAAGLAAIRADRDASDRRAGVYGRSGRARR